MRFTTLIAVVALAAAQTSVVSATTVTKRDASDTNLQTCSTIDGSSCGADSECVAAPNSVIPTLGLCKAAGLEDPTFDAALEALAVACPTDCVVPALVCTTINTVESTLTSTIASVPLFGTLLVTLLDTLIQTGINQVCMIAPSGGLGL